MTTFIIAAAILNALVLCLAVARLYHVRKGRRDTLVFVPLTIKGGAA